MLRIICDIDGVVADLHTEWYARYNRDWHDDLTPERVTNWDLHTFVKPECGEAIYLYLLQPDLYDYVQPIEGALDALKQLQAHHEIIYASGCSLAAAGPKAFWLERYHLAERQGVSLPKNFVATERKELLRGDLLIDDSPEQIRAWLETGHPAIHFLRPWGDPGLEFASAAPCKVVRTWPEVVEFIEEITGA
jgi:5'-nucleotidase